MSGTFDKLKTEVIQPEASVLAHTGNPCTPPEGAPAGIILTFTPELFIALVLNAVSLP